MSEQKEHHVKKYNVWMISTIVVSVVALILAYFLFFGNAGISQKEAGTKLTAYLNNMVGGGVEYVSAKSMDGLYQVNVNYQGEDIPVYITKDGKYFIQGVVPIVDSQDTNNDSQDTNTEVPKTSKPKVELFVMTHCPYGTQAEKGMIPVIKALGNKADIKIRFVHYFMHGDQEEAETYNQVCIREEQNVKYLPYLECFLEDGNSTRCLAKAGISTGMLNTCLKDKAKTYYAADSALSNQYGVQGSPTLVVNGVQASSGRSSSAFLETVCNAFTSEPSECSQALSTANPSAGFGYNAGTATSATC